ncbi:MAG TPA: SDR family NAD(P)-dependent oxidoreductase, partial [Caulobacteraceae bacterium]
GGTAVVTGAASGIGAELARQLAAKGCDLALADINGELLAAVAAEARAAGVTVSEYVVDVADKAALETFAKDVLAKHGRVTLLINNAGVALMGRVDQISLEEFEWLMNINFWGPVRLTHMLLPELLRQKQAHIVNLSSIFGVVSPPGQAPYVASKFGVRGFSESLRHELDGTGVGLTVVHPGGVRTAIADNTRISSAIDPAFGKEATDRFNTLLRTSAKSAAETILRGVDRGAPRVLIGPDAKGAELIQRLMPGRYWKLMKGLSGDMKRYIGTPGEA